MPVSCKDPVGETMHEFKHKTLHAGPGRTRRAGSRAQAIAIGMSRKRRCESGKRSVK